ncbi:hypothetical protein BTM495_04190 [Helicobacter pylori]
MILFVSVWPKVVSIAGGFLVFLSWMVLKFKDPFAMLTWINALNNSKFLIKGLKYVKKNSPKKPLES